MKKAAILIVVYLGLCIHCVQAQGTAAYADSAPKELYKISLQLQWLHQFQFAGYYAALEKGYYREAGLDVEIRPGGPGIRHFDEVSQGRATYGVGSTGLLLSYLKGKPLVALAVIFQHSPDILLAKKSSGIKHPIDLIGKRVMMLEGDGNAVFRIMLANEGISRDKINIIPSSFNIDDLVNDKVDAFNAYTTNEPFYLLNKGIEVSKINPITYGIDYYGDCIYTSRSELESNPKQVKKFRKATLKGWRYALDHKEEIIALILEKYSKQKTLEHMRFEANAIEEAVMPKLIEIGHMNPGRWQFMASTYEKLDIIKPGYSLDDFIYDPTPSKYPEWLKWGAYITAAIILAAILIVLVLIRFNKKLRKVVDNRTKELSEVNLDLLAQIDENQKTTEKLQINALRLQTLQELNSMTGASEKELTYFAMEAAVHFTRSTIGYISFMNGDETVLTMYAWSKQAMKECAIIDKPIKYPVATTGLWGEAVRQRRAIITNNYEAPNPYKKGTPDGHIRIMRHMNVPIFDGDRIVIVAGVGNKPTDYGEDDVQQLTLLMSGLWTILRSRRAEEALKESEEKYRSLNNNIPVGIFRIKSNGKIVDYNAFLLKILDVPAGTDLSTLKGEDFYSNPKDRQVIFNEIMKNKEITGYDCQLKSRSNKIIWASISARGVEDTNTNGSIKYIDGIIEDITEKKTYQKQLEKFATVIKQAHEEVVITDPDGVIQYVNPSFEKHTGYTADEVIGQLPSILKSGIHEPAFYKNLWQTILNKKIWKGVIKNKCKNGSILDHDVTITPILGSENEISAFVSIRRDITKQMELEQQFQQSLKMQAIGTLAGGIAHDFNNILSGIFGYCQLAQSNIKNTEKANDCISKAVKAAQRATELVQQILTFSRQTEYEKRPFCVYLEVNEALKFLRSSIPSTIDIKMKLDSRSLVLADPSKIHQVVMNLCTNAYHSMRKTGGVLTVFLSDREIEMPWQIKNKTIPKGNYLILEVSDTGCGMDENTLMKSFEPYFTTKNRGEGTGLGLAIVQAVMDEHDGFIEVFSTPGKGTHFSLYFPIVEKQIKSKAKTEEDTVPIEGDETVMIVDDEKAIRQTFQEIIENSGYKVVTFGDSEKALDAFKFNPGKFDIIITDMTMPGKTGAQLIEEIKSIKKDALIILCSGFSEIMNEKKAIKLGASKYLAKPIIGKDLVRNIRELLDQHID